MLPDAPLNLAELDRSDEKTLFGFPVLQGRWLVGRVDPETRAIR